MVDRKEANVEICQLCGAACCHKLAIQVNLPDRLGELFAIHYGQKTSKARFTIYHRCPHLGEDNLCELWGPDAETDQRPPICQEFMCEKTDSPEILFLDVEGM